eukprot:SAG31_NODE_45881_length_257_cov_0.556962_1_plen_70_part_10
MPSADEIPSEDGILMDGTFDATMTAVPLNGSSTEVNGGTFAAHFDGSLLQIDNRTTGAHRSEMVGGFSML